MDKVWEVDAGNVVKASFGAFGKKVVTLNGNEVYRSRKNVKEIPFALPDGRAAAILVARPFVGMPEVDLRVGDGLVVETGKKPIKCASCSTEAKPYDRFCGKCGKPMPTAEDYQAQRKVKHATGAIKILAVLFLVFGFVLYAATKAQADVALEKVRGMDPAAIYPTQIDGQSFTVQQVREKLEWEPVGVLLTNLVLAAIMAGLAWWGSRAPLPAVLIATATYLVIQVVNALADPATLGQGLIMKIIIIAFLFKGIKAALALRASNA